MLCDNRSQATRADPRAKEVHCEISLCDRGSCKRQIEPNNPQLERLSRGEEDRTMG
jgi:hypothetical protein